MQLDGIVLVAEVRKTMLLCNRKMLRQRSSPSMRKQRKLHTIGPQLDNIPNQENIVAEQEGFRGEKLVTEHKPLI